MARARVRTSNAKPDGSPLLWVCPDGERFPYRIQVNGEGWGPCAVSFQIGDGKVVHPARCVVGEEHAKAVKPRVGAFEVLLNCPDLPRGKHRLTATGASKGKPVEVVVEFEVEKLPEIEKDGRPTRRWWVRQLHFLRQRFPEGASRRPGSRLRAIAERERIRKLGRVGKAFLDPVQRIRGADRPAPPVDPGCNWYCIGPSVVRRGQVYGATAGTLDTAPISGRVTQIAIDPNDTDTIYAAAAQGGVWKSTDGGLNWQPKSDYEMSLAIGCVTVDPSVTDASGRSTRVLAGTGEPNGSDSYYGAGMLFSDDGGDTWTARGTATFARDEFSTIVVDPADNQHLFAATSIGVYESNDEGLNWTQIEPGQCFDLQVDWAAAGGPELYVGRRAWGVRYSNDGGTTWSTLAGGLPAALGRVALAMSESDSNDLYAAFADGGGGLTGIYRTSDGGTIWNQTAASPAGVGQSGYNFVLAVDPTDSDTLLFGEVHLWRSTNAGGAWTRVSTGTPGIHSDQHAIAYHPTDATRVYVGNDGGVFYSSDGGVTYTHRNKDLATLQYYSIADHPVWDAVLLGGTQDNGAQRYLGHPAWEHSALGDGAFAAINETTDTRRYYESRWWNWPCFRSDTAGLPGSWTARKTGIATNANWFYPPLVMDSNDSSVLYVGYDELWRTSNHAGNWTDITGTLVNTNTNITAIAVAPSDSNTLYVGMTDGKVFQVTFSAGTWTATDVTGAPLPAGQISDIAVDPTDSQTVYVTTSNLIFSEALGEFTNDHVFRTTDGGTNWDNISTGLAQTNPVNAIVVDPANPDTLFIGCDVGVFRSDDAGNTWSTWDDGLPNCSVQDLVLFAPRRLLRAATHGRSIWERPIDAALCPQADLYMRDDAVDTGLSIPSPSGVPHPFVAGETIYWYQSVDIKIDSPDLATNQYQTPGININYLEFEELEHDNPRRESFVRVHAQVHNRGVQPATDVKVRAFWANAGGGLPSLPTDFWTAFPDTDPADITVWHPVGPARVIGTIHPGQPQVASWSWLVPGDAPDHTCIFCAVTCDEDPVTTSSLVIGTAVRNDNNVTLKNLHVDDLVPGAGGMDESSGTMFIDFAVLSARKSLDIRIDTGTLPVGTLLYLYFPPFETRHSRDKALQGFKLHRRKGVKLQPRADEVCGPRTQYVASDAYVLEVEPRGKEMPGIYGILPDGKRFSAAVQVRVPRKGRRRVDRYTFQIQQWIGNQNVGGSAYELRVPKKAE